MKRSSNSLLIAHLIVNFNGLSGGRGDEFNASLLKRLPGWVGNLHLSRGSLPHNEHFWRGLEHGLQVVGVQGVAFFTPPSPNHPIRQDDDILIVSLAVYDNVSNRFQRRSSTNWTNSSSSITGMS